MTRELPPLRGVRVGTWPGATVLAAGLATILTGACTGHISGSSSTGTSSPPTGGASGASGTAGSTGAAGSTSTATGAAGSTGTTVVPLASGVTAPTPCTSQSPGPRLLRRLTAPQFSATLTDLFFGDAKLPSLTVFSDPSVLGFSSDADALLVQGLNAQQLSDYAETVAHWAVTTHLAQLSSCTTTDATCRQSFIRSFGKRAFREPVTDARVAPYDALFAAEATFSDGAEAVLTAMLQSPYFLYRRELGTGAGATVSLTAYEVASSLSYLLTGSLPDAQLTAAADNGQLTTKDQLDQQAQRLLQDPRATDAVMSFMSGWLGLDRLNTVVKDDTVFQMPAAVKTALAGETRAFMLDAFSNDLPVSSLFSARYSFLNQDLAQYYGIYPSDGTQVSASFTKVTFPTGAHRDPGLLGQGGLLTGYADAAISSPVLRGKLVRTRMLCQNMPPPPANVNTKLAPAAQAETTRQHFAQHDQNATCAACHHLMDPIGFGFEHYDAFGRWRDQENGFPIDATGTLASVTEGDVPFDGLGALSTYLASSDAVKQCFVRFWSYYAYGTVSWPQDACTYDNIQQNAAQYGLRDVLMAIIHAPHFTQRTAN
jgi:Protein of unknown function (DUF1592)/Protein of unknown function (DUF1588)/Protein of unknown function (DUF1595)/Protein of unknown function (DUF1587)/Protein of unknown function (DUF1585)